MESFIGTAVISFVLAYLLVFFSGEFHPKNQNFKMVLQVGAVLPIALLILLSFGALIS